MAKQWDYGAAEIRSVGIMVCSSCRRPIRSGQFRYRETEDGFISHHRTCSSSDPKWAELDAQAERQNEQMATRKAALREFIVKFGAPDQDLVDEVLAELDQQDREREG